MVVGLTAPTPTWKYYDDTKLSSAYTSTQSLKPMGWTTTVVITDTGTVDSSVKLVGVLTEEPFEVRSVQQRDGQLSGLADWGVGRLRGVDASIYTTS